MSDLHRALEEERRRRIAAETRAERAELALAREFAQEVEQPETGEQKRRRRWGVPVAVAAVAAGTVRYLRSRGGQVAVGTLAAAVLGAGIYAALPEQTAPIVPDQVISGPVAIPTGRSRPTPTPQSGERQTGERQTGDDTSGEPPGAVPVSARGPDTAPPRRGGGTTPPESATPAPPETPPRTPPAGQPPETPAPPETEPPETEPPGDSGGDGGGDREECLLRLDVGHLLGVHLCG